MRIFSIRQNQYNINNQSPAISFRAMKKSQFEGVELAVVEKFKAPIEKFNVLGDLQNWAKNQAKKIANTDFGGRQEETIIQRKAMLKEWADYVFKENDAYTFATALLVLGAITKGIKPDNDKLPPALNKGVLADCVSEIDKNTKADSKYHFDLNKMYETKLRALYLENVSTGETETKWVVIPSKENDPENFESNVEKLKTLSHKNWCTKSFNAEPYLAKGDFHVYLENGEPKLGVRFVGDVIQEIQGELNNTKIPFSYFDAVQKHITENSLKLSPKAEKEIDVAKKIKDETNKIKEDLKDAIENNDVEKILTYFNFEVQKDSDDFLTIDGYAQPSEKFTFSDCGIDENKLFEKIKHIENNVTFENSKVTNLGKLKSIGGRVYFQHSQIVDLGDLETIGNYVIFQQSPIKSLGKLKSIGGNAYFYHSQVIDLGKLESIGGNADFSNSQITTLGKLKVIYGNANFMHSQLVDLGELEAIGGNADFGWTQITNLGKLKTIGRRLDIKHSKLIPKDFENIIVYGGIYVV